MQKRDYDTKKGIDKQLDTLADFYGLLAARKEAAERGESLSEFVVTGYWWLKGDGSYWGTVVGNIFKPHQYIAKYRFSEIPDVLTAREFEDFICKKEKEEKIEFQLFGGDLPSPHLGATCKICRREFTGRDAYDFVEHEFRENPYLDDFAGKTFGEYRAALKERKDARYQVMEIFKIRHPRFSDLRDNEFSRPRNPEGIMTEKDGITDDYVIEKGDRTSLERFEAFHKICHYEAVAAAAQKEFTVLFDQAGFSPGLIYMKRIPNEYGSSSWKGPWFEVETSYGPIVVGWRSSVMCISWRALGRDMMHLFDDIDNTKEDDSIHAWTYEEAIEILRRIRQAIYGTREDEEVAVAS